MAIDHVDWDVQRDINQMKLKFYYKKRVIQIIRVARYLGHTEPFHNTLHFKVQRSTWLVLVYNTKEMEFYFTNNVPIKFPRETFILKGPRLWPSLPTILWKMQDSRYHNIFETSQIDILAT